MTHHPRICQWCPKQGPIHDGCTEKIARDMSLAISYNMMNNLRHRKDISSAEGHHLSFAVMDSTIPAAEPSYMASSSSVGGHLVHPQDGKYIQELLV